MSRFVSALVALLMLCVTASAQPRQSQLTWIRYFQVPSHSRTDLVKTARAPFDKLMAEGKVTAWGVLEPVSKVGEPWTHAIYASAPDWAAIDAVTAALDAAGPIQSEHAHDVVLRHVVQSETPPIPKPKFLVVNLHPVNRGRHTDAVALFNEWAKPVFVKIAADGKLGPWGLSTQSIVLDNQWTYMVWYFISDTSVLEDIHAALVNLGLTQLQIYERRLRAMSEDDYIGQLLRVVHSAP